MSSKLEAYEVAYERLTLEKTAEAYAEAYGTEDGYLPEAYLNAYMELEKEAHVENMVNTFAPETGYIPAKYVSALEKEAGLQAFGNMMKNTARGMMSKVSPNAVRMDSKVLAGAQGPVRPFKVLNENATLGDAARFYGAKALGTMANNPGATAAGLGLGAAGAGYGGYRMMGGGNK